MYLDHIHSNHRLPTFPLLMHTHQLHILFSFKFIAHRVQLVLSAVQCLHGFEAINWNQRNQTRATPKRKVTVSRPQELTVANSISANRRAQQFLIHPCWKFNCGSCAGSRSFCESGILVDNISKHLSHPPAFTFFPAPLSLSLGRGEINVLLITEFHIERYICVPF